MPQTPFNHIKKILSSFIPSELIYHLPDKWEKIGTVVTIKLPKELKQYQEIIGKIYAEVLGCSTTLNEKGEISGIYREPNVEVLFGSQTTETIHVENGIRYKLDPQKIMFSSGNMAERKRMATIAQRDETVVDLFAGIGYFTLPMAVYSKPKKIVACEMNPLAFHYLCSNIVLNHVSGIVKPLFGDNRIVAPTDCADRVILDYLKNPEEFLQVAFKCLRSKNGIIHYHSLRPVEKSAEHLFSYVETVAKKFHCSVKLLEIHEIKSYAPQIHHTVLDIKVLE